VVGIVVSHHAVEILDDFIPTCRYDGDMYVGAREMTFDNEEPYETTPSPNCRLYYYTYSWNETRGTNRKSHSTGIAIDWEYHACHHLDDKKFSQGWLKLEELFIEIRKYISISAFTGLLTAIGNLILLLIMGVDFPVLWAFLSFLFSFIPSIGFILSVLPPAILAFLDLGLSESIIVLVGFILINAIIENVLKPRVMGEELNLSLSIILISLIVWAWILGAIGAILAIPLTISAMKTWEILFVKE